MESKNPTPKESRIPTPMVNKNTTFLKYLSLSIIIIGKKLNKERRMVKKEMFYKVKVLQNMGYNIARIKSELKLDHKTVTKYFKMSEQEFLTYRKQLLFKDKVFDAYAKDILEIYQANNNRKVNMSAIYDYLEEQHGRLPGSERSLRNFIYYLEATDQLSFDYNTRVYNKVRELPFGQQMQLDFGEYKFSCGLKLFIFAVLLSASRFKFALFQDTPFKTKDVIHHLLTSFDYFGGIPIEMVIDQDRLLVVSENRGDIIFTKEFSYLIEEMDIKMYVCRKADPESKGKIENFIGYIKHNFLEVRDFNNVEEANKSLQEWLVRRANGKISQATKRIPAEDIKDERGHLKPIRNSIFRKNSIIGRENRTASDKGYISVQASQYLLPSKYRNKSVEIYVTPYKLIVYDIYTGKEIVEYDLSQLPGKSLEKREFKREIERSLNEIKIEVSDLFTLSNWEKFLKLNFKKFNRYVRDQALDALKYFKNKKIDPPIFDKALDFCIQNQTVSIAELNDTYQYYLKQYLEAKDMLLPDYEKKTESITKKKPNLNVKRRNFATYKKIISSRRVS